MPLLLHVNSRIARPRVLCSCGLGIGLWPDFTAATAAPETMVETQRLLAAIGYETPQNGILDEATVQVLAAFQRHYRPARCDGVPDAETRARIAAVAAACGV